MLWANTSKPDLCCGQARFCIVGKHIAMLWANTSKPDLCRGQARLYVVGKHVAMFDVHTHTHLAKCLTACMSPLKSGVKHSYTLTHTHTHTHTHTCTHTLTHTLPNAWPLACPPWSLVSNTPRGCWAWGASSSAPSWQSALTLRQGGHLDPVWIVEVWEMY